MLTWFKNYYFLVTCTAANQEPTFTITDTKRDVPVAILSTQNNLQILKQLQSGSERRMNCNKCQC